MRDLQAISRHVAPDWTNERADRVRRGIVRKTARRRAATVAFGVVATAALAVIAARIASHPAPISVAAIETPAPVARPIIAETRKTTATPLSSETKLDAEGDRAYVLHDGSARFVVAHDAQHPFTVRAGDVLVEDVGTVFTVAFTGDDRLDVSVTEGRVRVSHDGIASSLGAGEHIEVAAHAPVVTKTVERARPTPRDEVAPLLRAADDARAAGHPESALDPLRRVIAEHPSDSRAGLAAFTLGRVLDELDRPKEAADAFAIARAHGGPMAADALGREVVARSRAGDQQRALELGNEYLQLYPRGDRAREVLRVTGTSP
jgi:hypothetical protein